MRQSQLCHPPYQGCGVGDVSFRSVSFQKSFLTWCFFHTIYHSKLVSRHSAHLFYWQHPIIIAVLTPSFQYFWDDSRSCGESCPVTLRSSFFLPSRGKNSLHEVMELIMLNLWGWENQSAVCVCMFLLGMCGAYKTPTEQEGWKNMLCLLDNQMCHEIAHILSTKSQTDSYR